MTAVATVFIAFCIVMVVVQMVRARTHGPRVRWLPRRWRPRVSDYYRRRGWSDPYDSDGNRVSWWRKTQ
jgi:hypothetical protein